MIVVAIIGILAAVALPAYQTYTEKARFSEVVLAVSSVKSTVDICYQTRGDRDLDSCDTYDEVSAVKADAEAGPEVATVVMDAAANSITGTGSDTAASTYVLTATVNGGSLTWAETGTCIANGVC